MAAADGGKAAGAERRARRWLPLLGGAAILFWTGASLLTPGPAPEPPVEAHPEPKTPRPAADLTTELDDVRRAANPTAPPDEHEPSTSEP